MKIAVELRIIEHCSREKLATTHTIKQEFAASARGSVCLWGIGLRGCGRPFPETDP